MGCADRSCLLSGGIVLAEMLALKLQDGPDQLLTAVSGHLDKAGMEAVGIAWVGDGVDTQYLKRRLKEHLVGKKQRAGEDLMFLKRMVECDGNAASTQIDSSLDESRFGCVGFLLQADRDGDSDAIVLSTISRRWGRCRGVGWHGGDEYTKIGA